MEYLKLFQFFGSVSEELVNISRKSFLDFGGIAPHLSYMGHVPQSPQVRFHISF